MARRSNASTDPQEQVGLIKSLLDGFLDQIQAKELRAKVRSLIPVFHSLRDLGSGLMPEVATAGARDRILAYLKQYPRTLIEGDELLVVSGIGEWARRVRELRVEQGWSIFTGVTIQELVEEQDDAIPEIEALLGVPTSSIRPDHYILMRPDQDREAAHRWNQLNEVRKRKIGVKAKILEYLLQNVGNVVTGEELRYLASGRKEWARRTRELRTEDGWSVVTRMQGRPDLNVGDYLLETDQQAEEHDRKIPDDVRVAVMTRDKFQCTFCGWGPQDLKSGDPRKFLEVHHIEDHVKKGSNLASNLALLCNVHHDAVHRGSIIWTGNGWNDKVTSKTIGVSLTHE